MERSTLIIIVLTGIFSIVGIVSGASGLREWKRRVEGWKDTHQSHNEYNECLLLGWTSGMCLGLSAFAFLLDIYLLYATLFL